MYCCRCINLCWKSRNNKEELKDSRVKFEKVDIRDRKEIERIISENKVDYVVNFAARITCR